MRAAAVRPCVVARAVGEGLGSVCRRLVGRRCLCCFSPVVLHIVLCHAVLCVENDRVGARVGSCSGGRLRCALFCPAVVGTLLVAADVKVDGNVGLGGGLARPVGISERAPLRRLQRLLCVTLTVQMAARVVLAQVGLRMCLVGGFHSRTRRCIALEARAGTAGGGNRVARLRAAMVSRGVFGGLLHLLGGLVQLVQVLAEGRVSLHALANDMALDFVLDGSLVALGGRLREMRLRGRLSGHGSGPFGPRMSFVGGCHAYFCPAAALRRSGPSPGSCLAVVAATASAGGDSGRVASEESFALAVSSAGSHGPQLRAVMRGCVVRRVPRWAQ